MRGLLSGMDWIRDINPAALPKHGMTVAVVGRLRLVLDRTGAFDLIAPTGEIILSGHDLDDLRELMDTYHEWATVHKLQPK